MGGALFSIVLHFSRKKESVFDSSEDDVFVLQKEERIKDIDKQQRDEESLEKHDILESDLEKSGFSMKDMNQQKEQVQKAFHQLKIWMSESFSRIKSITISTFSSMSSLFSKFTQAIRDQISAKNISQDSEFEDSHSPDSDREPSEVDFKSLYDSGNESSPQSDVTHSPEQQFSPDESMPKRVPEKEMSFFAIDTEDELAEEDQEVMTAANQSKEDYSPVEKEPQKKAETFVKGLMDDDSFPSTSEDDGDVISDNYYYMYMEKRYIKKIVSNPKDVEVYRKLGDLYVEMENYADAQASFEQVLRLKPGDKHAILALKELEDHM
jgi:tetratricopeptide (TPR) repeat protein